MKWLNKHLAETTASRVGGKERADRRSEIHPTFGELQSLIGWMSGTKRRKTPRINLGVLSSDESNPCCESRCRSGVRRRSQPTTERNSSFSYTRVPPLFFRSPPLPPFIVSLPSATHASHLASSLAVALPMFRGAARA